MWAEGSISLRTGEPRAASMVASPLTSSQIPAVLLPYILWAQACNRRQDSNNRDIFKEKETFASTFSGNDLLGQQETADIFSPLAL